MPPTNTGPVLLEARLPYQGATSLFISGWETRPYLFHEQQTHLR